MITLLKDLRERIKTLIDKSIITDGVNGVIKYGEKNDYPQIIERLVSGSITGKSASRILSKFLAGNGFEIDQINKQIIGKDCNGKDITVRKLLSKICDQIAIYNGCYVYILPTIDGLISHVEVLPFKNCRFSKSDDNGYSAKIGVYNNWEKTKDLKYDQSKIKWYHIFNLDKAALAAHVEDSGGIGKFKGQIYFNYVGDAEYKYPLAVLDTVYLDMDTEQEISVFLNNTIRNGFIDKTMIVVPPANSPEHRTEINNKIKSFLGADGDTALIMEGEYDDNGQLVVPSDFKIESLKSNINDKLFENWNARCANNIRKCAYGLPARLIDFEQGTLTPATGEGLKKEVDYYNLMTLDIRNQIEQMFEEIFTKFDNEILKTNTNWKIKKLDINEPATTTMGTAAIN